MLFSIGRRRSRNLRLPRCGPRHLRPRSLSRCTRGHADRVRERRGEDVRDQKESEDGLDFTLLFVDDDDDDDVCASGAGVVMQRMSKVLWIQWSLAEHKYDHAASSRLPIQNRGMSEDFASAPH